MLDFLKKLFFLEKPFESVVVNSGADIKKSSDRNILQTTLIWATFLFAVCVITLVEVTGMVDPSWDPSVMFFSLAVGNIIAGFGLFRVSQNNAYQGVRIILYALLYSTLGQVYAAAVFLVSLVLIAVLTGSSGY